MMMATLMTHNNQISNNVTRNIQDTAATEGYHNMITANVNVANLNIAGNQKTDKEDTNIDKFV